LKRGSDKKRYCGSRSRASNGSRKENVTPSSFIELWSREGIPTRSLTSSTDEGETLQSHEDLETNLINYFQNLLTEPIPNRQAAINKITRHIPSLVTQEQNAALLRPFTIEEVDQALQDTPKCKAPGPDGFTSDFFTIVGR
jgi:hypothetical protein